MNGAPAVLVNGLPGSGKTTLARVAWEHWRCTARPLKLGPVLRVDTTGPVDAQAVIAWVQAPPRCPHPTG